MKTGVSMLGRGPGKGAISATLPKFMGLVFGLAAGAVLAAPSALAADFSCAAAFTAPVPLPTGNAEDFYRLGLENLAAERFSDADRLFRTAFVRISDMTDRVRAQKLEEATLGRILETSLARNRLEDAFFQLQRLQEMTRDRPRAAWLDQLMRLADERTQKIPEQVGVITAISKCRAFGVQPRVNLRILFEFDRADLTAEARATLARLAGELGRSDAERIVVRGHTDASGSADYNLALSQKRAQSVADFLAGTGGVPSGKAIIAQGAGESELLYPAGANDAATAQATGGAADENIARLERRVELQLESRPPPGKQ